MSKRARLPYVVDVDALSVSCQPSWMQIRGGVRFCVPLGSVETNLYDRSYISDREVPFSPLPNRSVESSESQGACCLQMGDRRQVAMASSSRLVSDEELQKARADLRRLLGRNPTPNARQPPAAGEQKLITKRRTREARGRRRRPRKRS
jgi:hypothetical protein